MKWVEKHPVKSIVVCGIVVFLFHLNVLPVSIMEARNFITAREMITDGNWLLTTMNDLPRYQKPPLPSWFSAVFGALFGTDNVSGLRIPTMLMAILGCVVLYFFSFTLLNQKRTALINALILCTSFYYVAITNEAPWDIYTHVFMLISIYFLFKFFRLETQKWKYSILGAVFFGLSFMSKGPISLYALLLPFLIAYGITYKFEYLKKKIGALLIFLIIGLAIGLWWFVYVRVADPNAFLAITKKETGNWGSYNVRPFYYYWSFFTQSGIWTIPAFVSLLYPYLKNKVSNKKAYQFSFLWTILVVILLSVIPEKKSRYLMPVLIPLAINTGFYIDYIVRTFKVSFKKGEKIPVYFHFGLMGLLGLCFPIGGYLFLKAYVSDYLFYFVAAAIALVILGGLIFYFIKKQQFFTVFILTIAFIMAIKTFAFPMSKALQKNPNYKMISTNYDIPIYSHGELAPEFIWHYGSAIPITDNSDTTFFPDTEFGILVSPALESNFKRIFEKSYSFKLVEHFDINPNVGPDQRGYKKRLTGSFYLVNKK